MGILNVTPDSFYKESRSNNKNLNKIDYGLANILDIGFESSRPGAIPLSKLKEINRLSKFLSKYQDFHRNLSIDTYKHEVADFALKNGFKIINDIRGGGEKGQMFEVALKHNAQIVIMHMKGDPLNMQKQPFYKDVINELLNFFDKKLIWLRRLA